MKRKIYFAGSIRGGRTDSEIYSRLISHLSMYGEVLTEHVGSAELTATGEEGLTDDFIFQRDIRWIENADVIIAEVSTPSIGVGYEIASAEMMNKPILCLYREIVDRKLSAMIAGNTKLHIVRYVTIDEAFEGINRFFRSLTC
jgi:2'-deoxynucleoside 5'-phosphate N-hydrolase